MSATAVELIAGGADLMPIPGRYLTAPSNESVVSLRLDTQATALCGAPDWDTELSIGCYESSSVSSTSVLHSRTFRTSSGDAYATLERCERECRGRAGVTAFSLEGVDGADCKCLSAAPENENDPRVPNYFCSTSCAGDETQLCGGYIGSDPVLNTNLGVSCWSRCNNQAGLCPSFCGMGACCRHGQPGCSQFTRDGDNSIGGVNYECTAAPRPYYSSIYSMPAQAEPCTFNLDARVTPQLDRAYGRLYAHDVNAIPRGGTLTLEGSGFSSGTMTTVTVCGGVNCPVTLSNETHIICTMPACPAAASQKVMVHVAPHGYAAHSTTGLIAHGVLTLTGVRISGTSNSSAVLAEGSAAGGVLLTLSGDGFDDVAAGMRVEITHGASEVVQHCEIISTSRTRGEIECRTQPAPRPIEASGHLCAVRVLALSTSGAVVSQVTLASAYKLVNFADAMSVSSISPAAGSAEGGLLVCIEGQNLNQTITPTVLVGSAACDTTNTTQNASLLCCTTSNHSMGLVNVSVHSPSFGHAIESLPNFNEWGLLFNYTPAPTLFAITPTVGHAGSEIDIEMSDVVPSGVRPIVTIGNASCVNVVVSAPTTSYASSSVHITCNVTDGPPGTLAVSVNVPGVGLAEGNLSFTMGPAITAISPEFDPRAAAPC